MRLRSLPIGVFFLAGTAYADPLALDTAIRQALENAPALRARQAQAEKAALLRSAAWSDLGPKVQATYQYQRWDSAIRFNIDLPPEYQALLPPGQEMGGEVRPRNTWSAGLTVAQPFTGLYAGFMAARLAALNLDQARIDQTLERRRTRIQAIEAWYGLHRARRAVETLTAMRHTVESHLEQAREFRRNGMLRDDDLLRIQVQAEQVAQNLDLANTAVAVASSQLALLIGRPLDAEIDLGPIPGEQADEPSLDTCLEEAAGKRAEVRQAENAVAVARTARDLHWMEWMPQVSGVFNYTRATANQFSPASTWFVGVMASWTPWEWGKTWFQYRAAGRDVAAASHGLAAVTDLVRLEVKADWLAARTARANIARTSTAVAQASENLRIQMERSRLGMNTTTDVLDAETLLLQAESEHDAAVFGYRVAREKLHEAMGR